MFFNTPQHRQMLEDIEREEREHRTLTMLAAFEARLTADVTLRRLDIKLRRNGVIPGNGQRRGCGEAFAGRKALGPAESQAPRRPSMELRDTGSIVNVAQRLITVIAVPYEQPAQVEYRSEVWNEIFERGAFRTLNTETRSIRVNRDHDKTRTIGKIVSFHSWDPQGLIVDVRIAKTPLGDETLALADEQMLSASVGFGVPRGGEVLDRRTMTRRIKTANLDHLAFVESPAYTGAHVLSVIGA